MPIARSAVIAPRTAARTDRFLVKFRPDVDPAAVRAFHQRQGSEVLRTLTTLDDWQVVRLAPGATVADALSAYQASPLVELAEPDWLVHACILPNDPAATNGTQWALHNLGLSGGVLGADIHAEAAWEVLNSIPDTIVAIVDSGIRETHRDLIANLWTNPGETAGNGADEDKNGIVDDIHGFNAIANDNDLSDGAGHGTHIAGIIGGVGNNGTGMSGVAWKVQLMACKFMAANGDGAVSDAARCVDYARLKGATVINASWAGPTSSTVLRTAIDKARQAGIFFVAAAGNDGGNNDTTPSYPSAYSLANIVTVASTTQTDELSGFSNFGATTVDLAAPGSSIYSTSSTSDTGYLKLSGTSMAAPHVAAALAMLRARHPAETMAQVITRLLASTDPLPDLAGKCATGGRLNLAKALVPDSAAEFSASPASGLLPLTVQFTDSSVGTIVRRVWNFGDDSPEEVIKNPKHVFSREGEFTVTLTLYTAEGPPSVRTRTVKVLSNYRIEDAEFAWVDPTGMTPVTLANNEVSPAQPLPFAFTYYGQNYNQLFISANGMVGFVNTSLAANGNTDLPTAAAPNATLYPYWDDLDPGAGGTVYFGVTGEAPTGGSWSRG